MVHTHHAELVADRILRKEPCNFHGELHSLHGELRIRHGLHGDGHHVELHLQTFLLALKNFLRILLTELPIGAEAVHLAEVSLVQLGFDLRVIVRRSQVSNKRECYLMMEFQVDFAQTILNCSLVVST